MSSSILHSTWGTSECILCDVVQNEEWVPYRVLFPSEEASSQIILETPSYIVIPDIGPIVEGYCLIVSKDHVPAMAHLGNKELDELLLLKFYLTQALNDIYGPVIIFEHGELTFSRNAGSCIDHAHLHFVPCRRNLIITNLSFKFSQIPVQNPWKVLHSESAYLYYEDQNGNRFYTWTNSCDQQFFRRRLVKAIGTNIPWNWRDYVRYADILGTREKVNNCIQKLKIPLMKMWLQQSGPAQS